MCSQYTVKSNLHQIGELFSANIDIAPDAFSPPVLVVPGHEAPVLMPGPERPTLTLSRYSLLPSWSKEEKLRFATHNARLDRVDTSASWKKPFLSQHCIAVLDEFIEPIYTGEYAGNMIAFHRKDDAPLLAAAIYDTWTDRVSGRIVRSFAMLTDEAEDFVQKIGHDREPLFLNTEDALRWLRSREHDAATLRMKLRHARATAELSVHVQRPLKAGWEKRVPKGD